MADLSDPVVAQRSYKKKKADYRVKLSILRDIYPDWSIPESGDMSLMDIKILHDQLKHKVKQTEELELAKKDYLLSIIIIESIYFESWELETAKGMVLRETSEIEKITSVQELNTRLESLVDRLKVDCNALHPEMNILIKGLNPSSLSCIHLAMKLFAKVRKVEAHRNSLKELLAKGELDQIRESVVEYQKTIIDDVISYFMGVLVEVCRSLPYMATGGTETMNSLLGIIMAPAIAMFIYAAFLEKLKKGKLEELLN